MARRTRARSAAAVYFAVPPVEEWLVDDALSCDSFLHGLSTFTNDNPQAWIAKLFYKLIAT